MQLSNMELNDRTCQALSSHGIAGSLTYLFLKPCLNFTSSNSDQMLQYISECFELSLQWLAGASVRVLEKSAIEADLQSLIQYLIHCKRDGLKPKIILIKSVSDTSHFPSNLVFIELSKTTITGIAYTAYKLWEGNWCEVMWLCQEIDLFYLGLMINPVDFKHLQEHLILPVDAIKNAQKLWLPECPEHFDGSHLLASTKVLLEAFRITSIQPTHLYYSQV